MKKAIILLILFLIPITSARVISLTTTVSTDIMLEYKTKTSLELLNSGDEAANNVQISLILPSVFNASTKFIGDLKPNEPKKVDLDINLVGKILPGNYLIVVLTDYTDANGYPFSAVSPGFLTYKNSSTSKLSGSFSELTLHEKESKKLSLLIRNSDNKEHDVDVKLILPKEIKSVENEKKFSIGSSQEKTIEFEVSSLSAISGSSYAIIASMEYDYGGLHHASYTNGIIKIDGVNTEKEEQEDTSILAYVILFISIVFILIYTYPKYIKRGKKIEKRKDR